MQKLTQKLKIAIKRLFPVIDDQRGSITPEQAMGYVNSIAWEGSKGAFSAVSCEPLRQSYKYHIAIPKVTILWSVKAMYEGELVEWAVWAVPASPAEETSPITGWTGVYGEW